MNDKPVHVRELVSGDVIRIAGISLRIKGDCLESCHDSANGLSIAVRNMSFTAPGREQPILDDVTFSVEPGQFIGILGPSGCGKSSLIQRLVGLSSDYDGEVFVNGHSRAEVEDRFRALTAYLPQSVDATLHDSLTLEQEIDCFRRLHIAPSPDEAEENDNCLKTLGLSGKLASRVGALSGGEKRRVAIALALLRSPSLLLLDEPGSGLDPASEGTLMRHLRSIADQGRTILCATHVLDNIDLFDKILLFSRGRVVYFGPPAAALPSLGVRGFAELFALLAGDNCTRQYSPPPPDSTTTDLPESPNVSTTGRQVYGYARRFFLEFVGHRARSSYPFLSRLFSLPAWFFLWQPLGIVLGLRIACANSFRGDSLGLEMLSFCAALAVFWIGINNSAREFVKERVPSRSLERLNRVSLKPYVLAKILWVMLVSLAQTLLFTLLLAGIGRIPLRLASGTDTDLGITLLWFFPLFATCLMGSLVGLAVSACAKVQTMAISAVPNFAIFALLFSNSVVGFEKGNDYYALCAKWLAYAMPCHWPAKVMTSLQENANDLRGPVIRMLCLFGAYLLTTLILIPVFQRRNEQAWDGR